jgi:2-dehydro-3-deoxygluconokinase
VTRVVCIGECMVEFTARADGSYARAFAGDAYNTAVYLKRAAPWIDVQFVTAIGEDDLSEEMRRTWRGEGIDAALAFRTPEATPGLYIVATDGAGERRFTYWRGQSAARRWLKSLEDHGGVEVLAGADLVYFSGVSLAILPPGDRPRALAMIAEAKSGATIAFDPNVRPSLWESRRAMAEITEAAIGLAAIVLPSLDDADELWAERDADACAGRLLKLGPREVALTLGAEGCLVADPEGALVRLAAPPTRIVDTSAAGDAFNGAYLASRLGGETPAQAARAGLALAAHVVGRRGALAAKEDP